MCNDSLNFYRVLLATTPNNMQWQGWRGELGQDVYQCPFPDLLGH